MENELQEDQPNATIEKAYTIAETYKRILNNRVILRLGRKSPLAIEPLEVVFPSFRLKGKKPLSASILVGEYLRPAAVRAGVISEDQRGRFGLHNFRHSLASSLVKLKKSFGMMVARDGIEL